MYCKTSLADAYQYHFARPLFLVNAKSNNFNSEVSSTTANEEGSQNMSLMTYVKIDNMAD